MIEILPQPFSICAHCCAKMPLGEICNACARALLDSRTTCIFCFSSAPTPAHASSPTICDQCYSKQHFLNANASFRPLLYAARADTGRVCILVPVESHTMRVPHCEAEFGRSLRVCVSKALEMASDFWRFNEWRPRAIEEIDLENGYTLLPCGSGMAL